MPILGFLDIAIAIFFAVHAVRTGRQMYWIMILIIAPFLGSLIYFFAEYLPEIRHSNVARKSARVVKSIVDPNRELREARLGVRTHAHRRQPLAPGRGAAGARRLRRGGAGVPGLRQRPVRDGREVPPRPGACAAAGRASRGGRRDAGSAAGRFAARRRQRRRAVARSGAHAGRRDARAGRLRACQPRAQHHRDAGRLRHLPGQPRARRAGASAARGRAAQRARRHRRRRASSIAKRSTRRARR